MKKTLAIFLAIITLLSVALVACKKDTPAAAGNDSEGDPDQYVSLNNPTTNNTETSDTNDDDDDVTVGWTEREGTVYLMANNVNVRSQSTTGNNIVGKANMGDSFSFTAVNGKKWYKISFNNAEAYISAAYVTENAADADFTTKKLETPESLQIETAPANWDTAGKGYAIALRANASLEPAYGEDDTVYKADITAENPLKKIAENASGTVWQVEYKGKTYYMGSAAYRLCDNNPNNNNGSVGGQG